MSYVGHGDLCQPLVPPVIFMSSAFTPTPTMVGCEEALGACCLDASAVNRFTASVELTGSCFCTLAVPGAAAGAEARRERRRVAGLVSVEAAGAAAERADVCFGAEVSVDRAGEDSEVSTAAGVASPPLCCDSSVAGLWARRERLRRLPRDRCSWDESCAGSSVKAAVNESNVSDC